MNWQRIKNNPLKEINELQENRDRKQKEIRKTVHEQNGKFDKEIETF